MNWILILENECKSRQSSTPVDSSQHPLELTRVLKSQGHLSCQLSGQHCLSNDQVDLICEDRVVFYALESNKEEF